MVKITLEFLKQQGASEDFLAYIKALEWENYNVLELIKHCIQNDKKNYSHWLFQFIDNQEEFMEAVKYYMNSENTQYDLTQALKYFAKDANSSGVDVIVHSVDKGNRKIDAKIFIKGKFAS